MFMCYWRGAYTSNIIHVDIIRNSVFNGKNQAYRGVQTKVAYFILLKRTTVSLIGRRIDILLVDRDLHNG